MNSNFLNSIIEDENILNIYLFGSTVYGTRNEASDYDYIVVCKELPSFGELYNIEDETFHFHTIRNFELLLGLNEIQTLECLYLPKQFILKEDYRFEAIIDKHNIRTSVSTITSNSFVKGKKKLIVQGDYDKYIAIKSIFHSIRILDFAIQILTENKIVNYSSMNWVMVDLLKISEYKESVELWDLINTKYLSLFKQKSSEFKKLAPKNNDKNITINSKKQNIVLNNEIFTIINSEDFKTIVDFITKLNLLPIIKN